MLRFKSYPDYQTIDIMVYTDDGMKQNDIENKARMIWAIADKLTGLYKPHEYGQVILPFTLMRRFDCVLKGTRDAVLKKYEEVKDYPPEVRSILLESASGYRFYNTREGGMRGILNSEDTAAALRAYINSFSENVQEILSIYKIDEHIERMSNASGDKNAQGGVLREVIDEFTKEKNDLSPEKVSDIDMGYIFEHLVRMFSESYGEDAGQHYTPREVIDLMCELMFRESDLDSDKSIVRTVYDPACGTGGMLSESMNYTEGRNRKVHLQCFGQEVNPETYAICRSDMLIKNPQGNSVAEVRYGNTLSSDQFPGMRFNYIISNPPFGREWKVEETAVKAQTGEGGRFRYGTPRISDSQMLFLSVAVSAMDREDGGRVAIIHNGSALFSGDPGSGESEIRRYILENDLLDAVVSLPEEIFYNTGIGTYIWILDNRKEDRRRGKVQLIDASKMFVLRRKSVGKKRVDIDIGSIETIVKAYRSFENGTFESEGRVCGSKVVDASEFGYLKVPIVVPELDGEGRPRKDKKGKTVYDKSKADIETVPLGKMELSPSKNLLGDPEVKAKVEDYLDKEVRPYVKGAEADMKKAKIGFEIPFTRYFYKYTPPRPSEEIRKEIDALNNEITTLLKELGA